MKILFNTVFTLILVASLAEAKIKVIDIEELPAKADFIVIGTVIDSTASWDEQGVMINTVYTIQVEENVLGNSPPVITMSFAGGSVGDKTIIVAHSPVLEKGEKYILFSYAKGKYSIPVVGHAQGIFRVVYDQIQQRELVVDYNWYQMEITDEAKMIRGPLTELDASGALRKREVMAPKKPKVIPEPVIRDVSGNEIPQDRAVFVKPKARKRGNPVTKSEFVEYFKTRMRDREATR